MYENASLQVNNPVNTPTNGVRDGHSLFAGDDRASWCAADRQCVEKAEIYATGYFGQDLFGAEGRYTDGQTHHVEFLRRGTSLSVARQPSGSGGVPEPGSLALVLAACGLGWGVTRRRVG